MLEIKRALISVYDKNGIVELAKVLSDLGISIFATGGTAEKLKKAGIKAGWIAELTGFPEILGGKVKTLHPDIFARILATEEEAKEIGIERFQLIVVNLYPPELEPDIGGVSLIRAGIKAGDRTLVLVDNQDYNLVGLILKNQRGIPDDILKELNKKAAIYVLKYQIENYRKYFGWDIFPYVFEKFLDLRYGTNPGRKGNLYSIDGIRPDFEIIKGEVSLNNLYDCDSAVRCAFSLSRHFKDKVCACVVKHGSPSGVALGEEPREAIEKAWESDSKSAYGGVLAVSSILPEYAVEVLKDKFLEVICAPAFEDEAVKKLMMKKARIIRAGEEFTERIIEIKNAMGGALVEEYSDKSEDIKKEDFKPAYEFDFSEHDLKEMIFSYEVARFTKSNAVVISSNFQTLGIGGGFTSRVDAAEFAIKKTKEFLKSQEKKNKKKVFEKFYVSSDGFFPFPDSVEIIANELKTIGAREIFIAHPGGSIRDKEVIETARKLGVKMFITSRRCFRH